MITKETIVFDGATKRAVAVTTENGKRRARVVKFKNATEAFYQSLKAGHGFVFIPGDKPLSVDERPTDSVQSVRGMESG